jgi:HK97 gp10 family phage protein
MAFYVVEGAAELERRLSDLDKKVARRVIRQALRAGANTVLPVARAETPVRTGKLRKNVKVRTLKRNKPGTYAISVTSGATADNMYTGEAYYGAFVHFGHKIGKRSGRRAAAIQRYARRLRAASREARKLGPGMGLAKKGSAFRVRQERYFLEEASRQTAHIKDRSVPGNPFLDRAYKATEQTTKQNILNALVTGIEQAAKEKA